MKYLRHIENNKKLSIALTMSFATLAFVDIVREYQSGESFYHLGFEFLVALMALSWTIWLWKQGFDAKQELSQTKLMVESLNQSNRQWLEQNKKLMQGLAQSIDEQMNEWSLTPAEKEVSLLLLKGLSFKEIAEIRSTSEKTTRQQALNIYQKSGLPGRAELSAFFLEDLLSPKN